MGTFLRLLAKAGAYLDLIGVRANTEFKKAIWSGVQKKMETY